jgi:hypothetical protein
LTDRVMLEFKIDNHGKVLRVELINHIRS